MTYMLLLNCALKLVEEIILYYDARSKKHKKKSILCSMLVSSFRCVTDCNRSRNLAKVKVQL